jgi:DNA mismatch endonuclease (patch repair protein)
MKRRPSLSRSEQMSRIRGKNTGPERRLRSALWKAGLRYLTHAETPLGRPDVVFPRRRIAVFIDGCFWHGCPQHYVRPRTRTDHWEGKLRENVDRDRQQTMALEALGWSVVRAWEHEVYESLEKVLSRIRCALGEGRATPDPEWRVVRVEEIEESARLERRHLEQLRDPSATRTEEGRRITAKWRRPQEG